MEECKGQQDKSSPADTPLPDYAVTEPQTEYGEELFEKYQQERGAGQTVQAVGQMVTKQVEK